ncbi:MAG TPA: tetratricopeptide repeat protein [Thermoanaerobaculia bacterium]|nr:tetratricopeptide repeat protein [Thermoanaerobaculia bacterium]
MKYRNSSKLPRQIARELGVEALVRGSLVRDSDRLRLELQLIDGMTARELWRGGTEGSLTDVLILQRDLAKLIAAQIGDKETKHVPAARTVDSESYDLYLQGAHLSDLSPFGRIEERIELFEKAIAADPTFAQPHAALARTYLYASAPGKIPYLEACMRARSAAERAVQLDAALPEGLGILGFVKWACDRDWTASGSYFRRALELNPNDADTVGDYAVYLDMLGRNNEAIATQKRAVQLDPLTHRRWRLGVFYLFGRRYDEAIAEFRKILLVDPSELHFHRLIAMAYAGKGAYAEAVAAAEKVFEMAQEQGLTGSSRDGFEATLAFALAAAGERRRAEEIIRRLQRVAEESPGWWTFWLMHALSAIGEPDQAFALMEKGLERGSWAEAQSLWRGAGLDRLRSDPRYHALMKRFGMPVEQMGE